MVLEPDKSVAQGLRSSIYEWSRRAGTMTATHAGRQRLAAEVRRVFKAQRETAGCRQDGGPTQPEGTPCSVGLVADLMREQGLKAGQPRTYKTTTVSADEPDTPDSVERKFKAAEPGTALCRGITHLRAGQGRLDLAPVIHLAARMDVKALGMVRPHGDLRAGPDRSSTCPPLPSPSKNTYPGPNSTLL